MTDESKVPITEHDQLKSEEEPVGEKTGLVKNIKNILPFEINGLFYIVLGMIVLATSLTIAMILSIFFGPSQLQAHAGVSSEIDDCSTVGLKLCKKGGSAVDAAIGMMLCISLVRPDLAGLGGCGSMIIHNHTSMENKVIDMSCMAPPETKDTAINNGYKVKESVAIPGILSGFDIAYRTHGRLNWTVIIDEVLLQFQNGVKITDEIRSLINQPEFSQLSDDFQKSYKKSVSGSNFELSTETVSMLISLKVEGANFGINGTMTKEIVKSGFKWTDNFKNSRVQTPLKAIFGDYVLMTSPLPLKGGLDLAIPLEILNLHLNKITINKESARYYHVMMESIQISQAVTSFLGDSKVGQEKLLLSSSTIESLKNLIDLSKAKSENQYGPFFEHTNVEVKSGTQISIVDSFNMYVSLSLSMGSAWGSGITIPGTQLLLNDAMREFLPTSTGKLQSGPNKWPGSDSTTNSNAPKPQARPLSQLAPPVIVYNLKRRCGVRFSVGGGYGVRGTTGILQMIMSAIYLDQNFCPTKDCMSLSAAGVRSRLHVNILNSVNASSDQPASLLAESNFNGDWLKELREKYNHSNIKRVEKLQSLYSIGKIQYEIHGYADNRFSKSSYQTF